MVQSPPSPALLHIPPPATVKYSGCLAAAAAAQLPVSFTPVLRLTAACSLFTARPSLGLRCSSSGRGSRCRWRAAAGCSWCAESCQCVTNSSSAGAACGPGGVRAGTGVQPSHRHHPGRHSAPPHRRAAATCPLYTGHTTVTTQPPAATTPPPRDVDTQCQGHSQEGGHRCLLCPLYSAEPLYCTVQLPGLVAVVQVASPPARQPRYCIIIMVGAAPAPAPAPAAGNPGVVLWCCPAATTTATPPTTPPQRNDWEQDIFLQAADTPAYQHYSITTNQPRYMDYRQHCTDWLCNIVLTEQIKICVLKRGELLQLYCVFILTSYHFNYGCVMSEIKHSYSINVTTAECAA